MTDLLDLLRGEQARDAGVAAVDANSDDAWRAAVDAAIETEAASGRTFTADSVRAGYDLGEPHHHNAWGARFLSAARRGLIVRVGYVPSQRVSVHAHPVAVWQGTADPSP